MDTGRAILVICLTLIVVVGINAAIYVMVKGKNTVGQIELLRRAAQRARDPWQSEDASLRELSQRVANLPQKPEQDGAPEDEKVEPK